MPGRRSYTDLDRSNPQFTPYLVKITVHRDGAPADPVKHLGDAVEAAGYLTSREEDTEPVDPDHGFWNVWLPERLVRTVWSDGISLDLSVGGYRLEMEYDPA